jgi:Ca2+/H+ antiporter
MEKRGNFTVIETSLVGTIFDGSGLLAGICLAAASVAEHLASADDRGRSMQW